MFQNPQYNLMFQNLQLQSLFSKSRPIRSISEILKLQTFIENYPDESLIPSLFDLFVNHKHYRKVCGDGNCFYRATMFLYLKQANLANYQALFPPANLLKCKKLPIKIKDGVTSQQLLQYLWQTQLFPLAEQPPCNREMRLLQMLNKSIVIDTILVAYFRVLNHDYLLLNKYELQAYTQGDIQNDIQRVLIFGEESEGIEIYTCSKILNLSIEIVMVHQENLTTIVYNEEGIRSNIKLFFRPGHYDIICKENEKQITPSRMEKQRPPPKIQKQRLPPKILKQRSPLRVQKQRSRSKMERRKPPHRIKRQRLPPRIQKQSQTPSYNQDKGLNKINNLNLNALLNQPKISKPSSIISFKKPSEIKVLIHPKINIVQKPKQSVSFKDISRDVVEDKQMKSSIQTSASQTKYESPKKLFVFQNSYDNQKYRAGKIFPLGQFKKRDTLKKRVLTEIIVCGLGVIALLVGVLAF